MTEPCGPAAGLRFIPGRVTVTDERDFETERRPYLEPIPEEPRRRSWAAAIVGIVIALIGLVLTIGGAWLAVLGGSLYYLIAGVLMIVSGVLLVRGRTSGGWLYLGIVVASAAWAWWEVGANPWAQVPRVIAPVVLALAVILVLPTLTRRPDRWRVAGLGVVAALLLTVVDFWEIGRAHV